MCPHAQMRHDRRIRCLLVHDHVLLRQGLQRLLEDEPDVEVVAVAGNAAEGLRKIHEHHPQIVIAGANIFEHEFGGTAQLILQESPGTKLILLSADESDRGEGRGIERTLLHTTAWELIQLIRNTAAMSGFGRDIPRMDVSAAPLAFAKKPTLTVRERQVLKLLAEGRTVRSVAAILELSVKTVEAHKFNLMRKLGIHNKAELVMWAIQKRIVKLPVNL